MTGLVPVAFTPVANGVQYIAFYVPMDGRGIIVRKTVGTTQTLFEYTLPYTTADAFLAAWSSPASLTYQAKVDVEANLAPLFSAFGGATTVVQMAPTTDQVPQHVIVDNRAEVQKMQLVGADKALAVTLPDTAATAAAQAQELAQLQVIAQKLTAALPLPAGAASEATLLKLVPAAAPALTRYAYFSASASQGLLNLKAGPTNLYKLHMSNAASSTRVLSFYNKASAPVANDKPELSFVLTAGQSLRYSLDGLADLFPLGLSFSIATTQGPLGLLTGTALLALGANEVFFVAHYV